MDKNNNLAIYFFHEGTNFKSYEYFGCFLDELGATFRVWAPNAKNVYVTGEFCGWETKKNRAKKLPKMVFMSVE